MKNISVPIIMIILFFCACQKEVSDPILTTLPENDSTTLIKFIDLDTSQAVGLDTFSVCTYTYDNSKRLIRSNLREYNSSGIADNQFETILYYNLTDTLPFKKIETVSSLPGGTITNTYTGYFNYSNGKLIFDSIILPGSTIPNSRRYSYENDKIIETNDYLTTNTTIYLTKANSNTIHQTDTIALNVFHDFSFSYDSNHNPFYGMPQSSSMDRSAPYYYMETYTEEMVYERNNITEVNEFEGNYHFYFKYFYEYNSNGYPSVARVFDQNDPTNFFKRIFIYTKL